MQLNTRRFGWRNASAEFNDGELVFGSEMPIMQNANHFYMKWLLVALALVVIAAAGMAANAQTAPAVQVGNTQITGLPDDWTHRHLIFSDPGTEQEAIQAGRHEQWLKVVNDPRYVLQQLKKNLPVQGPAAVDAAYRARWMSEVAGAHAPLETPANDELTFGLGPLAPRPISPFKRPIKPPSEIKRDWSESLGGTGLAAGQYPAKYSLSTTTASCDDYIVFPTGASSSTSQATIVAFNNIYDSPNGTTSACNGTSQSPTVYWAYYTPPGGTTSDATTANLSPVVSWDGTQVAFIETYSSTAYLVILKMPTAGTTSGNTYSSPAYQGNGLTYEAPSSYFGCTAPCYTTIALDTSGTKTDTSSAPFYDYGAGGIAGGDEIYVGDDAGKVHQVTAVFNGTPTLDTKNSGWPFTATTETHLALNGPIYDALSGYLFVGDASGYLHQFLVSSGASPGTLYTSGLLEHNTAGSGSTAAWDPPIVDPVAEHIYAFIGYSGDTNNPSYINSFPVTGTGSIVTSGSYGSPTLAFPNGTATNGNFKPTTSSIMRAGTFDDRYFATSAASGFIYTCVDGNLYQVTMPGLTIGTSAPYNTPVSASTTCSPVSEFLGAKVNTTLSVALSSGTQTYVCVASTSGMFANDYIQIGSEIMEVTGFTGTACSSGSRVDVTRGLDGTTAGTSYAVGTAVQDINGDWIFLTVAASGTGTGCTGACLYNYNVLNAGTTGTATAGFQLPSGDTTGTSGIVIDNLSTSQVGAQMLYYSTQGGDAGVQASQSNP
jgi:hypothetical protein